MEDILYYILIGIGYALYSWLTRKRHPQPVSDEEPPVLQKGPPPKQVTFEELLREITQARQAKQNEVAEAPVVDYDEEIEEEAGHLEEAELKSERPLYYEDYEKAKRIAFQRPSLEETARLEDVQVSFDRFDVFEQKQSRNLLEEYTSDLHHPEGLKKAFVLSEILNRKYF
ncbi:MAG: hypothetical protein NZM13_10685 [Cyclobacteriaceae bacterium]|nr:hypothetical protein [Cyclobacteriaceae bacterium]